MKLRVCYIFQSQPVFWKLIIGVMFGFFMTSEIRWLVIPGYKDLLQCKVMSNSHGDSHPSPSKQQPPTERKIENIKYDIPKKELLLVGVMTANKYLENRAVASFNTWGKNVPGKILYFSSETSNLSLPLPIVALPTVDDSYPPQKKSFLMLKYMYENYGDKFEWFMRADDDVYLRTDKLEAFLRRANSSKTLFIGQAGRGIQEEFGLLSLEYDENYCMGGPGIIMSHATLAKVAPNVKDCLHNLYTTHEDVEIGRCVQKFAGIPCTWSYEMQLIMYHNSSGREAFTGKLKSKEVHRAISLHPIKQHTYLYRLHNYMNSLKIEDLMYESIKLRREVRFTEEEVAKRKGNSPTISYADGPPESEIERMSLSPSLMKNKATNETTTVEWDFMARTLFSTAQLNPRRKLEGALKESVDDIVREVMESINTVSKERGRIIDFKDLLYGYHRVTPLYGSDYVLDLLMIYKKYRGKKMTVPVRRHSYLQRAFAALEVHEITCQPGSGRLNACDKLVYNSDLLATGRTFYRELRKQSRRLLAERTGPKRRELKEESMDYYADLEKEYPENKMPKQIDIQQQEAKKEYQEPKVDEKQEYSEQKVEKIEKEEMNNESDMLHDEYEEEPLHFTANEEIYFIVPLSGRVPIFERFLKNYETVCLVNNEPVHLVLVLYPDPKDTQSKSATFDLIQTIKDKYSNFKVKITEPEGAFSRGVALELGASECPEDSLLFLVDVDISFTTEALERIRLNTIRNSQIYYPIVFSEFDPASVYRQSVSPDHFLISELSGYWRFFGYGIVSMYHCDLRLIGGYDTSITGWGKEDVDLFDKAVKSNLTIFRSADPGLSHVFHSIECDSGLETHQRDMCLNSKANTYVSQKVLAQFLIKDSGFKEFLAKSRTEG